MDKKYAQIVFLQGDEAIEPYDIFDKYGTEALLDYLKSWDFGEYNDIRDESSTGFNDQIYKIGDYIISYNPRILYFGLQKLVK